jgi:secondary thiamine-phosphate synthase enzyme
VDAILIVTRKLEFQTRGENDIVNISEKIQDTLLESRAKEGFVVVFVQSSTSSLSIMEFEEGLLSDIPASLSRLAPKDWPYEHEKAYRDGNGHSHVKSFIVGVDLIVPFSAGRLLLGTWQQIVLSEFDVRPRRRSVIVQIVSD